MASHYWCHFFFLNFPNASEEDQCCTPTTYATELLECKLSMNRNMLHVPLEVASLVLFAFFRNCSVTIILTIVGH